MKLKPFQKHDLARLALHDGAILAWDTGLGKTWAWILWSLLKAGYEQKGRLIQPRQPCLVVAPGDLHDQICAEARTHFRVHFARLGSQSDFLSLSTLTADGRRELPPGFYLTSYSQLCQNGVHPPPSPEDMPAETWCGLYRLGPDHFQAYHARRATLHERSYRNLGCGADAPLEHIERRYREEVRGARGNTSVLASLELALKAISPHHIHGVNDAWFHQLPAPQAAILIRRFAHLQHTEFLAGIGETRVLRPPETDDQDSHHPSSLDPRPSTSFKCVYQPTLADLAQDTFTCVAVDEGVRMKGEDSLIGIGVRQMRPPYRLVSTATPIKNRLPDIFRLAWWAVGGHEDPSPRFPYANSAGDRGEFAKEFLVGETSDKRSRKKLTPNVCNVHRLWKLIAPVVLRRRKKDVGEQIVTKHRHVIRAPMGTQQRLAYKYHLKAPYLDCHGRPAPGAKLQALRMAAAAPHADNLHSFPGMRPGSEPEDDGIPRSAYAYLPKHQAALSLILEMLRRGEQVVVGSAFLEPLNTLSGLLAEAGVRHLSLDGRVSPAKRGKLSAAFQQGPPRYNPGHHPSCLYPVVLAGVESTAEGHNWYRGKNVILIGFSWAYDKFEQLINRIHRLNSPEDVHIWSIICNGTIDRTLEVNIQEKGDAAELVLDGHLLGENPQEVNLAELVAIAETEFDQHAVTLDESILLQDWPLLRAKLTAAQRQWDNPALRITTPIELTEPEPAQPDPTNQTNDPQPDPTLEPQQSQPQPMLPTPQPPPPPLAAPAAVPAVPNLLQFPTGSLVAGVASNQSFNLMPAWRRAILRR